MDHIVRTYPDVLFQDLAVIEDATDSGSQEFMQAVRKHLLDERIPIHIPGMGQVRVPRNFTVYDALWYLFPEQAPFLLSIRRNKTIVKKSETIRVDDILEFTF